METIDLSAINYLAVLVAALAHMVVGLVWFSRRLFGEAWVRLAHADLTPARQWLPVAAVGHLAIALVLAILMLFAGVTNALGGLVIGLLVWAGFVVTLEIGELVWEKIPVELFALRIGNHLVALGLAGAILGAWR
jgi:sterol desaturase/sphingolipid hydroxylase (fatty acid hydroxylase superfamily)